MDTSERPTISIPTSEAPAELQLEDLVVGEGLEAVAGAPVAVDYVGVAWSNGQEFDASWNRGDQLEFTLGTGQVIAGWDQGVQGMKVGGRRQITIPPQLAYGESGQGPISPNETLVFTVDLRQVG